jgi:hypothetical protein
MLLEWRSSRIGYLTRMELERDMDLDMDMEMGVGDEKHSLPSPSIVIHPLSLSLSLIVWFGPLRVGYISILSLPLKCVLF